MGFQAWLVRFLRRHLDLRDHRQEQVTHLETPEERSASIARRTRAYLKGHFHEDICLEEVSRKIGVGTRQLNRVFNRHYQTTVKQALLRLRLNHALELLRTHPEYSVKAIAYECGFKNPGYFSRSFLRSFGVLPSAIQSGTSAVEASSAGTFPD
jgi:AraC-like DNA-binding protein